MIKKLFLFNIDIEKSDPNYNKFITSSVVLYITIIGMSFFAFFTYFNDNSTFYIAIIMLVSVVLTYIITRVMKSAIFVTNAICLMIFLAIVSAVYIKQAGDYVVMWAFIYPFFATMLLGHKKGIISAVILYAILFYMTYNYIGITINSSEYARYVVISILLLLLALAHEYTIYKTLIDLQKEKEKAQKHSKSKSEFLANMSHEIRTPMNGIIGMTHLALNHNQDKQLQHYLETINLSSLSLLHIINDILDFSKIEAGKLQIQKHDFDIHKLIETIHATVLYKIEEKKLNLEINFDENAPQYLHGDSLRISQVLINLLNNAIKFTQNGFIKITIKRVDNKCIFEVHDSGIGISKEQQLNLFKSFSQADASTTKKYGGTGLGLAISKQLVELMDGKIWCSSEVGIGSLFSFELEMSEVINSVDNGSEREYNLKDIKTLKNSKILLVDDNEINLEIVIGLLKNSGIIVDIARDGEQAVLKAQNNNYELIFMDIQMPILDGYEATKLIRKDDKNIPIIALTANAMIHDIEKTKDVGMNEHLNKPIDIDKLYMTLLKYISKKVDKDSLLTESKAQKIVIPSFDYIDTKQGLKHLSSNKELYLKLLAVFQKDYSNFRLEDLADSEFNRAVHTLKGLSANLGAVKLNQITQELDENSNEELYSKFYFELSNVISELNTKLQIVEMENKDDKIILPENLRVELFLELKNAVNSKQVNQCQLIIKKLDFYILSTQDNRLYQEVKALIGRFKFKDAIKLTEEI